MTHRLAILTALCLTTLAGCASAPSAFHDLSAAAPPSANLVAGASLLVGPVTLPAGVDRPQLVLEQADGRLMLADQQRWVASLPRLVSQTVALDLSRQTGLATVYAWPQAGLAQTDLSLLLDVRVFRLAPGKEVELEAGWSLLAKGQSRPLRSGVYHARQPVTGTAAEEVVKAQSTLLAGLSQEAAAALSAHPDWLKPAH
ncbi:PqiC family protein [uncultured Aquitalea sp.]|uniref:PqiC family protein n=1 Tax=uncultured Aquitalea sp. TaxID=540272 RepID=UPI0025E2C800|nr:PqiC family protein [uncultured Aquitalea sp.]